MSHTRTDTLIASGTRYRVYRRTWGHGGSDALYLITTRYGRAIWRVWDNRPGARARAFELAGIPAGE